LNNNDGYDKIKVEIEFNKEVTSDSSGLVYVCFGPQSPPLNPPLYINKYIQVIQIQIIYNIKLQITNNKIKHVIHIYTQTNQYRLMRDDKTSYINKYIQVIQIKIIYNIKPHCGFLRLNYRFWQLFYKHLRFENKKNTIF
jgi:hypothetical protein